MDGMESIVNVSGSVIRAGITDPRPDVTARARLLHAVGSSVHALVSTFSTLGVAGVTFLVCRASLGWSTNVPAARGDADVAP